ncbi:LysR family transcriptional regulator [Eubacterium barkeri]|uniref:DNA-binding transcriptional regulator, LysR family n=1 Tax=Eubacterium barkeri TaxID=1528 RepID=A0A1H3BR54_EUBBA|nr:LysR family transcriptional regulator [Eubacterium barkeri]SDX44317.1 DNA-binding transcriptional regulator, LysR family [Eubacterium barkeri]
MDLRVLTYFLAVAREGNITSAAETLHLTQPTLSRQLKDLEEELGKSLFVRGKRKIILTEEGLLLRKRAEELTELARKTKREIMESNDLIQGDIYIGAGETQHVHYLTKAAKSLRTMYLGISIHISSGDTNDITDQLDKGMIDFGLLFDSIDGTRYDSIKIPSKDTWGVLMLKTSPLAEKESISPADLKDYPLIIQRGVQQTKLFSKYLSTENDSLQVVGTYSLAYNASIMVKDGIGYALCIDGIINTGMDSEFCFRPFTPALHAEMSIAWKKYQYFSKPQELFLNELRKHLL